MSDKPERPRCGLCKYFMAMNLAEREAVALRYCAAPIPKSMRPPAYKDPVYANDTRECRMFEHFG